MQRLIRDTRGASAVEYLVQVGVIALAGVAAFASLGDAVEGAFLGPPAAGAADTVDRNGARDVGRGSAALTESVRSNGQAHTPTTADTTNGHPRTVTEADAVVERHMGLADTAAGRGDPDGYVSHDDLRALLDRHDTPPELRAAATLILNEREEEDRDCGFFSLCTLKKGFDATRDFMSDRGSDAASAATTAWDVGSAFGRGAFDSTRDLVVLGAKVTWFAHRLYGGDHGAWGAVGRFVWRAGEHPIRSAENVGAAAELIVEGLKAQVQSCVGAERSATRCAYEVGTFVPDVAIALATGGSGAVATRTSRAATLVARRAKGLGDRADPHLSPLGRRIQDAAHGADPERSLIPGGSVTRRGDVEARPLIGGREIFERLGDMIAGARREVVVSTFVWRVGSDPSDALLDGITRLERRLRSEGGPTRPVDIRLLVHAHRGFGQRTAAPLVRAVDELGLDPRYVRVQIATRESWGPGAMHQKLAVVDGETAHLGGANVQGYYDWTRPDHTSWHDAAFVLHGDPARALLPAFDGMWAEGRTWRCAATGRCRARASEASARPAARTVGEGTPVITLTRRPSGRRDRSGRSPQSAGITAAMAGARRVVRIHSPNLNDDAVKRAIQDALGRGVEVRIVLSQRFNERTQRLVQGGPNGDNVDELYAWALDELGPERACRLLRIRWFSRDGARALRGNGSGASHAKYLSVDGEVAIVGSANMDTQALKHSGEVNVAVDDAAVTRSWDRSLYDPSFARAVPAGCG